LDEYHIIDFDHGAVVGLVEDDAGRILMERVALEEQNSMRLMEEHPPFL
jgi:hypothetical protein